MAAKRKYKKKTRAQSRIDKAVGSAQRKKKKKKKA